jgi:hypothetical protein
MEANMVKKKNPMDEIVDELVVFRMGEDGEYASNNPIWQDQRIREYWIAKHGTPTSDEEVEQESEDEIPEYEAWTNQELRNELITRELSIEGKKDELVARLREDDAKEA